MIWKQFFTFILQTGRGITAKTQQCVFRYRFIRLQGRAASSYVPPTRSGFSSDSIVSQRPVYCGRPFIGYHHCEALLLRKELYREVVYCYSFFTHREGNRANISLHFKSPSCFLTKLFSAFFSSCALQNIQRRKNHPRFFS